jgi:DNA excision repair protein ERCC-4
MTVIIDTRDPWPHPWSAHRPPDWLVERGTMETGDVCLAGLPDGVVIERKTPADLAACLGRERERFERELRRGRYCGRFIVVVEGDLAAVVRAAQGIHRNAVIGTLAAWSVRFCPFIFAGDTATAAAIAFRALAAQVRDAEKVAAVSTLAGKQNATAGQPEDKTNPSDDY